MYFTCLHLGQKARLASWATTKPGLATVQWPWKIHVHVHVHVPKSSSRQLDGFLPRFGSRRLTFMHMYVCTCTSNIIALCTYPSDIVYWLVLCRTCVRHTYTVYVCHMNMYVRVTMWMLCSESECTCTCIYKRGIFSKINVSIVQSIQLYISSVHSLCFLSILAKMGDFLVLLLRGVDYRLSLCCSQLSGHIEQTRRKV